MESTQLNRLQLTPDLNICRILNGLWQVSGAHGLINRELAITEMFTYIDAGLTTWDLADHYGPAEEFVGEFRQRLKAARGEAALTQLQFFTKWVPRPVFITRKIVEDAINRSLHRMNTSTLDLLQFHWWDYQDNNYLN
ncbi:MAG: aldo/keto reductase, partial [Acidobacteriota bacterium]